MARVQLDYVIRANEGGSTRENVHTYVYERGTTTEVTGYTTSTGSTEVTYPLLSNAEGRFPNAYYPSGSYDVHVEGDDLDDTQSWEALSAEALLIDDDLGVLPAASGSDDAAALNAVLAAGGQFRGRIGSTYRVGSPLVVPSHTTLDMTGCTVELTARCNMLQNAAVTPTTTATNVATTAGGAVVVSATLAAVAQVGQRIGVVGAGPLGGDGPRMHLYATVESVAGSNITITGTVAGATVSGATGYLYGRDTDITLIGGYWDAGTNWNTLAQRKTRDSNQLLLRRIDGLHVKGVTVALDDAFPEGGGWVFGVAPGDVTDFLIEDITGEGSSTVVQADGPLLRGAIRNIYGSTKDDMVALGAVGATGTTGALQDTEGDITDVVVDGVFSDSSWTAVKLFGGRTGTGTGWRTVFNVTIQSVKGSCIHEAVQIIDYAGSTWADGIVINDISAIPGDGWPQIQLDASALHTVNLENIQWPADAPPSTGGVIATGYGVQNLRIRDLNISGDGVGYIGVLIGDGAPLYESVDIDGVTVPDASVTCDVVQLAEQDAVVLGLLSIRNVRQRGPGWIINNLGRRLSEAIVTNVRQTESNASLYKSVPSANATVLKINDWRNTVPELLEQVVDAQHPMTVFIDGLHMGGNFAVVRANDPAASPVRVVGHNLTIGGGVLLGRSDTQAISVDCMEGFADAADLTPQDQDIINNSNAAFGPGIGRVIYNAAAARWESLYATSPVGELGYAQITANSTTTTTGSYVDHAGLSVTATVGTRPIVVEFFAVGGSHSAVNALHFFTIREGSTDLAYAQRGNNAAGEITELRVRVRLTPSPGVHTYKLSTITTIAGTVTIAASATGPGYIQVIEV